MNLYRTGLTAVSAALGLGVVACSGAPGDSVGTSTSDISGCVSNCPSTATVAVPPVPPSCGDDLGYRAPNCVITWPNDQWNRYYQFGGYAVKTASGACPDIPTLWGTWHATVKSEGSCPSFPFGGATHALSSPWCDYTFAPNGTLGAPDPSNGVGLCTPDTVLMEPIVGVGGPWGGGCSGCIGAVGF
jgi:hypothetical protein